MNDLDRVKRQKAIAIIKAERKRGTGDGLLRDLDQCSSGELFSHLLRRGYVCARNQTNFVKQLELPMGGMMEKLKIEQIRLDGGTQSRAEMNMTTVEEYAEAMKEGAQFPPIIVIYDGTDHWLGDGFHRHAAAKKAELPEIVAEVRQGTRRDAVLLSVSVNANHGLRRSPADKRRAVETLLRDEEWRQWSDREIGRKVQVDHKTVGAVRADLVKRGEIPILDNIKAHRGDTEYTVTKSSYPPVPSEELDVEAARQIALEIVIVEDRDGLRSRLGDCEKGRLDNGTEYWLGANTVEIDSEKLKVGKNQVAVILTTVNGLGLYRFDAFQLWDWAQERAALAGDKEVVKELLGLSGRKSAWIDAKIARKLLKYGLAIADNHNYYTITGSGRRFAEHIIESRPGLKLEQTIRATLKQDELYSYRTGEGEAALIQLYSLQSAKNGWIEESKFYAQIWLKQFENAGYVNRISRELIGMWDSSKGKAHFVHITELACQLLGKDPLPAPAPIPDLSWHREANCFVPTDAVFNAQVGDRVEQGNTTGTVLELKTWPVLLVRPDMAHGVTTTSMFDNRVTVIARAISPEAIQSRCDEIRKWALGVGLAKATTVFDEKKQLYILYATDSTDPRVMQKFVVGGYTTVDLENVSADVRSFIADLDSVVSEPVTAAPQPIQQSVNDQPQSHANQPIRPGDMVLTRTGHEGEVIHISGRMARVQTAHLFQDHKLETLTKLDVKNKYTNPDIRPGDAMLLSDGTVVKCFSRDYFRVCYQVDDASPHPHPNNYRWIPADAVTKVEAAALEAALQIFGEDEPAEPASTDNTPKFIEAFEAIDTVQGILLATTGEDELLEEIGELLEHARYLLGVRLGIIHEEASA